MVNVYSTLQALGDRDCSRNFVPMAASNAGEKPRNEQHSVKAIQSLDIEGQEKHGQTLNRKMRTLLGGLGLVG